MCAKWLLFIYIFIKITLIRSHDIRIDINVKDFEKNGKLIFTHVVRHLGNISTFKNDVSCFPTPLHFSHIKKIPSVVLLTVHQMIQKLYSLLPFDYFWNNLVCRWYRLDLESRINLILIFLENQSKWKNELMKKLKQNFLLF